MVKALLFDLTDTIQDFDWNKQWDLLYAVVKKLFPDATLVELKRCYQQVYESYRLGVVKSDNEFFDIVFRQMGLVPTSEDVNKVVVQHRMLRKEITNLPPRLLEILKALRLHFRIGLVSSGVETWARHDFEKFFKIDLDSEFEVVIFSQSIGFLKESGKLFEKALADLKLKPKDAAYIGNSYNGDMVPAAKCGMKTIFLDKLGEPHGRVDLLIVELSDLLKKVDVLKSL